MISHTEHQNVSANCIRIASQAQKYVGIPLEKVYPALPLGIILPRVSPSLNSPPHSLCLPCLYSLWFLACLLYVYVLCNFLWVCPYACLKTVPITVSESSLIRGFALYLLSSTESILWGKEWDTSCKSLTESYK